MTLIRKQQPFQTYSGLRLITQKIYPEFFTAISDYYEYSDFKYVFTLKDVNGIISKTKNPPHIDGGTGVFNPNIYLKNIFETEFNPEITTWTKKGGSIKNYSITVDEYSESILSPDEKLFTKHISLNTTKEDFQLTDFILNSNTSKFLTDWETERDVSLTGEYGTCRFLSGTFYDSGLINFKSYAYQITITIYRNNYKYYYRTVTNNPYYFTTLAGVSSSDTVLEDLSEYLLEFPITPELLNSITSWYYGGYTDDSGHYYSVGTIVYNDIIQECDKYTVQTYTWPEGTNGRTSIPLTFNVNSPKPNTNPVQIQWENKYGAFDFFKFEMTSILEDKVKTSTFLKERNKMNNLNGVEKEYYMGHGDYDRGQTTYNQDIETKLTLNSNWLSDKELLQLRDLWHSKNIFIYYNSNWYPVIGIVKSRTIETNVRGLKSFSFDVILSNKIYK